MRVRSWLGKMMVTLAASLMATPSAFAQNAGTIKLNQTASLQGKQLAAGEYKVTWVTHSPDAEVTLTRKKEVIATVQGKWVDRDAQYQANSVVYTINPDGSRSVLEIRFAGRKGALVFGDEAAKSQLLPAQTSTLASASLTPSPAARKIRYLGKPRVTPQTKTQDPLDSVLWQQAQPMMPAAWRAGGKHPIMVN